MKWFRLYHDLPSNRKLRKFSPEQKWAWIVLLCLASESKKRGFILDEDDDDIAEYCEFNSTQDYLFFLDKLRQKGLIEPVEGGIKIVNWDEDQYIKPSDSKEATRERKRKQRAKGKAVKAENVTRDTENVTRDMAGHSVTQRDVTPSHAVSHYVTRDVTPTDPDTDTDTDPDTDPDPDPDTDPDPDPFFQPPEQEEKKKKTATEGKSYPDPLAAQFAPKRWMKNGKLRPELLEFVARQFSDDMDMNPRTAARNHLLNLNRSAADPNNKEILEGYCDDLEREQRKTPTQSALTAEESSRILQKQLREMTDATNKTTGGPVRKAPATQYRRRNLCA